MLTAKDLKKYHQAAERILNAMDNSPVPISWHEMDRMASLAHFSKYVIVMRGTPNHDGAAQFRVLERMLLNIRNVDVVTEPGVIKTPLSIKLNREKRMKKLRMLRGACSFGYIMQL